MSAILRTRLLILLVVAGLASAGCDEQSVTITNSNNGSENSSTNQENGSEDNQGNQNSFQPGGIDDDGHGPDDDMELLEVGLLNGSWRVAVTEGDQPMVYFDIFQDKGEVTGSGDYWMGFVLGPDFDGASGELSDVEISGDKIEVAWNPTPDDEEMYWVEVIRQDDDTFTGAFKAAKREDTFDVVMTRRVFEDEDERDPYDEDVPPGYVEPRPGGIGDGE